SRTRAAPSGVFHRRKNIESSILFRFHPGSATSPGVLHDPAKIAQTLLPPGPSLHSLTAQLQGDGPMAFDVDLPFDPLPRSLEPRRLLGAAAVTRDQLLPARPPRSQPPVPRQPVEPEEQRLGRRARVAPRLAQRRAVLGDGVAPAGRAVVADPPGVGAVIGRGRPVRAPP